MSFELEWEWVAAIVFILAFFGTIMHENATKADRYAACEVRGGLMRNIDGAMQCVVPSQSKEQ